MELLPHMKATHRPAPPLLRVADQRAVEPVGPNYKVDFEAAEKYAKRLMRMCRKNQSGDLALLFHAFLHCKQEILDQKFFDPAISLQKRQVHVDRLLKNLAFIELIVTTRAKAIPGYPAISEELRLLFKLI